MGNFLEFFTGFSGSPGGGSATPLAEYPIDREFIALAVELIDEFIPTPNCTWHVRGNGVVPDADEPWNTTLPTDTTWPVRILFYPPNRINNEFLMYLPDKATNNGKILGIFYKTSFVPMLKDIVTAWDRELTVNNVDEIRVIKDTIVYIAEFGL